MPSYAEVNLRSVLIRIENRKLRNRISKPRKRGVVRGFSKDSRKRLCRLLLNRGEGFRLFFTVTYRKNQRDCKISKEHLNGFLTRLRKACGSELRYIWVLEFQARGAAHFHFFFDNFDTKDFEGWQGLPVRKSVFNDFKDDIENMNRFKFLSYLWLRTTNQLHEPETVRAACTLKKIYSEGFAVWYASKYMSKRKQKVFEGNIDESTGEIIDRWQGRYWGASRSLKNEAFYRTTNPKGIRILRKWLARQLELRKVSGLRLFYDVSIRDRLFRLCDHLDFERWPREDEGLVEKVYAGRMALRDACREEDYLDMPSAKVLKGKEMKVPSIWAGRRWQETEDKLDFLS